ncbi:hypothetical protein ACWT_0184 [Actinoplanes sp. SE50]|nr:hypothetical protein ACPL_300 [Actinoplanes sp. SE50/110]ATO79599.1 hypothetical protein ACWT_0184 [Actinoplanes sp. SE50]SLL97002.1 hypothetical protein ACSP50_0198 [Actinoplanes sp. SE50/110]
MQGLALVGLAVCAMAVVLGAAVPAAAGTAAPLLDDRCRTDLTDVSSAHARVWFSSAAGTPERDLAMGVAQAMEQAYGKLVADPALSFLAPLSDLRPARAKCADGVTYPDRGDGRLDVFVVPFGDAGHPDGDPKLVRAAQTNPYPADSGVAGCASWIEINDAIGAAGMGYNAVHEFMHAVENSYRCGGDIPDNDAWWYEASATWAEQYVIPTGDHPLSMAKSFFMPTPSQGMPEEPSTRWYGEFLFPWYIQHVVDKDKPAPQTLRRIWELFGTTPSTSATEAVDVAVGGLDHRWPEFARYHWNGDYNAAVPSDNSYAAWDGRFLGVQPAVTDHRLELGGAPDVLYPLQIATPGTAGSTPLRLPPLSSAYFHVSVDDDHIRSLVFHNGWTYRLSQINTHSEDPVVGMDGQSLVEQDLPGAAPAGLHVQALVKIQGYWHDEDLTEQPWRAWCRDVYEQHVEDLVVIVTNARIDATAQVSPAEKDPTIQASNIGCAKVDPGGGVRNSYADSDSDLAVSTSLTFGAPVPTGLSGQTSSHLAGQHAFQGWTFPVTGGTSTINEQIHEVDGDHCAGHGNATSALPNLSPPFEIGLHLFVNVLPGGLEYRHYRFGGLPAVTHHKFSFPIACDEYSDTTTEKGWRWAPATIADGDPPAYVPYLIAADGLSVTADHLDVPDGGGTDGEYSYTYRFHLN